MKKYKRPITREEWYLGQKTLRDQIKDLNKKVGRLIELVEIWIQQNNKVS